MNIILKNLQEVSRIKRKRVILQYENGMCCTAINLAKVPKFAYSFLKSNTDKEQQEEYCHVFAHHCFLKCHTDISTLLYSTTWSRLLACTVSSLSLFCTSMSKVFIDFFFVAAFVAFFENTRKNRHSLSTVLYDAGLEERECR